MLRTNNLYLMHIYSFYYIFTGELDSFGDHMDHKVSFQKVVLQFHAFK